MQAISKPLRFIFFMILLFWALYHSQEIVVPFCFGGLFAMLLLPVSRKMESKGMGRGLSCFLSLLLFVLIIAGLFALLAWQITDLAKDLSGIEEQIKQYIARVQEYINATFGISPDEQKQMMEKQQQSGGSGISSAVMGFMSSFVSILVNIVLVLVYIFLLLYFRGQIKRFILKLVKPEDQEKTKTIITKASGVAQQYLTGMGMMIVALWIMYGIGFSIVGVKHAIFFAILCGMLEIVPFIGNITGTTLTIIVSLAQGGGGNVILGILIVYMVVQFVQTYLLEPLVVGSEVNINPLFTILVLVVGETLWGIGGMVLAIPLLGIVKIICDHVDALKPYGYLIGEEKKKNDKGIAEKIRKLFGKK